MASIDSFNVNGTTADIQDAIARKRSDDAYKDAEYARQVDTDTYAGRNLASVFAGEMGSYASPWHWLRARVRAGNFAGIRIRDYLTLTRTNGNNVTYLVGAIDPYYNCGGGAKGHHIVMVPSAPIAVEGEWAVNGSYLPWNTTNTNQGTADEKHPYLCSNLHKWEIEAYLPTLPQNVRDNIMVQNVLLEERYSASGALTASTNWSWVDLGQIWSPSEMEMYGSCVWGTPGWSVGFDCQFEIFRQTKDRINGQRVGRWLRSVSGSSAAYVCYCHANGSAHFYSASYDWIRPLPCFLIG
ncbi:MAG: DUF6273 domain-containing protein [Gordonibacter sp.]|uniref:DUF6273 domain-containing protein n=1 Tax=Gordonibacter sp. TaxID=1968902 RepID=UPI002FC9E2C9